MASHYLFETDFCNPASGWEKGQVEKNVQDARRRLWQPMPSFPDLEALNAWLEERCIEQWGQIQHGVLPGVIADVHAEEVGRMAIEAGVATKTHVLNLLHRLTDGKAPPASPIDAPQALGLKREPLANVERYDALRDRGLRHAS